MSFFNLNLESISIYLSIYLSNQVDLSSYLSTFLFKSIYLSCTINKHTDYKTLLRSDTRPPQKWMSLDTTFNSLRWWGSSFADSWRAESTVN